MSFSGFLYCALTIFSLRSSNALNAQKNRIVSHGKFRNLVPKMSMTTDNDNNAESNLPIRVLAGASVIGAIEAGYLTFSKLTSSSLAELCTGDSCNNIISGPYSVLPFVNIPLSLLGFIGYSIIAFVSIIDLMSSNKNENSHSVLLGLSSIMATFSLYLMTVLKIVLKSDCPYCYLSAFLSLLMAGTAWSGNVVPNKTKKAIIITSTSTVTALASAFLFYVTSSLYPSGAYASTAPLAQLLEAEAAQKSEFEAPTVTQVTSPRAQAVALRLQKQNSKIYGAYWCSHCFNQKQNLGVEGSKYFEYIECDKKGKNSQYALCKSKNLKGYPTWEINGQFFPGEKTVQELEEVLTEVEGGGKK